jgi:hypothetical protein
LQLLPQAYRANSSNAAGVLTVKLPYNISGAQVTDPAVLQRIFPNANVTPVAVIVTAPFALALPSVTTVVGRYQCFFWVNNHRILKWPSCKSEKKHWSLPLEDEPPPCSPSTCSGARAALLPLPRATCA